MQFKEKEKSKTQCFNKKVALLTFHHSFNYGAVCQTYATCRALQRLGYDVEIIDLRIVEKYSLVQRLFGIGRMFKFWYFRYRYYPQFTKRYYNTIELKKSPPQADIYMVGSDQTWNPLITKDLLDAFLLKFGGAHIVRIAFSVSFGEYSWIYRDEEALNNIKNRVGEFSQISVREEDMVSLCDNLFNLKVDKTLDPTLLGTDFLELTGPIVGKHTLVSYKFFMDTSYCDCLKTIANMYGKKIELLGKLRPVQKMPYTYPQGVIGWIREIAAADIVFTDSFHGVALSILYKKNFIAFIGNPLRSGRIKNLLRDLELEDRLYEKSTYELEDIVKLCELPINYEKVDLKLNDLRTKSLDILARIGFYNK